MFPIAAVTVDHRFSGLKYHAFIIFQFLGQESSRGSSGLKSRCQQAIFFSGSSGENPFPGHLGCWCNLIPCSGRTEVPAGCNLRPVPSF